MKIKRYKKAHRILSFFQQNFDLQPPYTVMLDGTFCRSALEVQVLIKEQIPKYLGAQTKFVTTQCIIIEVEKLCKLSPNLRGTWLIVKQFPVHKCGHEGNSIAASSCIKSLLKKKNPAKYIVATQDEDLRQHIHRWVTGAPILYLHGSAPTLEKPTEKCQNLAKDSNRTISVHEENTLKTLKRQLLGQSEEDHHIPKKKKKPKNPNPLSCKKSKKKKSPQQTNVGENEGGRKRKRHKRKKKNSTVSTSVPTINS